MLSSCRKLTAVCTGRRRVANSDNKDALILKTLSMGWQIKREICTMKLVKHPYVVQLLEVRNIPNLESLKMRIASVHYTVSFYV